ncbi:hypothetical protein INT45_001753 [Circinella minor]|uniref:Uncharacterized protein n=1 Tax=Circinella minor TaxID=1195481 RepID=A0A8H7VLM0_9FUNG|nr:hypothetical protein INT45_001753 [Circinella minor]
MLLYWDQRRISGIPPAEQLRQQLAEITQKLQEIAPIQHQQYQNNNYNSSSNRCNGVRRSVTATTPMVNRKPLQYYPATISARHHQYHSSSQQRVEYCFERGVSDDVLSSKSNLSDGPLLEDVCKETPQHNMSLMKCYVEMCEWKYVTM